MKATLLTDLVGHRRKTVAPVLASVALLASCFSFSQPSRAQEKSSASDFTVHEWGTFTSIAGKDGKAVEWMPLTKSTDLPSFVEHFQTHNFKLGLTGTVRMETPVIYFYSTTERSVSVHVFFTKGLITEWYPHASTVTPRGAISDASLNANRTGGSVAWDSLKIEPNLSPDFALAESASHYYSARETSAAPIIAPSPKGDQQERFLFYRGVSNIALPVSAKVAPNNSIDLQNLSSDEIPNAILFERRSDKVGYRLLGPLPEQSSPKQSPREQTSYPRPELNASLDSLFNDLQAVLISQGLFPDEAYAMLQTWRDSWFEEGARLFYILPRPFVDSVLPLSIQPTPARTVRVFVGRLELVTPATERAVEFAFGSNDRATLAKYGRFLEPILRTMLQKSSDLARTKRLEAYLSSVYNDLLLQAQNATH
jgi:hypothetical protein